MTSQLDKDGNDWSGGAPPMPLLPALGHEIPVYRTDLVSRETWLRRRAGTIGASSVAAIMQRHPYSTPIQAWAQITGRRKQDTDDQDELFRMELGTVCEPQIRHVAAQTIGVPLLSPEISAERYMTAWPQVLRHPTIHHFTCNLDAVVSLNGEKLPAECKWTSWRNRAAWHALRDTRDMHATIGTSVFAYLIQVQAQLAITGLRRGVLIGIIGEDAANRLLVNALTGRSGDSAFDLAERDVVVVYVERDEAIIHAIEQVVPRFHARYVATNRVPPVTDHRDLAALRESYLETHPHVALVDLPHIAQACAEYKAISGKLAVGEQKKDERRACVLHALTEYGLSECSAGEYRVTYKADKRGKRTLRINGPEGRDHEEHKHD